MTTRNVRSILSAEKLALLRRQHDPAALTRAEIALAEETFAPLVPWMKGIGATFYDDRAGLAPQERERCLVALLTVNGAPVSLAVHVYFALMENLTVEEIATTIGLAGCYGGLPKAAGGFSVLQRTLELLEQLPEASLDGAAVFAALRLAF